MSNTADAAVAGATDTEVGSYFVANYPPFSVWTPEAAEDIARPALSAKPADIPLGLYLHIPFCRKRCHFCYFRVYTDKNASESRFKRISTPWPKNGNCMEISQPLLNVP